MYVKIVSSESVGKGRCVHSSIIECRAATIAVCTEDKGFVKLYMEKADGTPEDQELGSNTSVFIMNKDGQTIDQFRRKD